MDQAGSYVDETYLRFDFRHFGALSQEEIKQVEAIVNQAILADYPVTAEVLDIEEAKATGAEALFTEKYGQRVRVISVSSFSKEFCGGTHLSRSSQACYFRILSETGIASGVRRIEAVTGSQAFAYAADEHQELLDTAKHLKLNDNKVAEPVARLLDDEKQLRREIDQIHAKQAAGQASNLVSQAEEVSGIKLILANLPVADPAALREAGDSLKNQLGDCFILLAGSGSDKVLWLAMASEAAVKAGLKAGDLIRTAAKITGGGGGGRPEMAQAGGKDKSKVDEALKTLDQEIRNILA